MRGSDGARRTCGPSAQLASGFRTCSLKFGRFDGSHKSRHRHDCFENEPGLFLLNHRIVVGERMRSVVLSTSKLIGDDYHKQERL
jgi:hypothetical protein